MKDKFKKFDIGKIQPTLIEPAFIEGIATILGFGAEKYGKDNWKLCEDMTRYEDALERHWLAYKKGEEYDHETGKSHLWHMGCCLMFIDHFDTKRKEDDF